jgi:hypothetical protein
MVPLGFIAILYWNWIPCVCAQDMSPRAFWPAPDGTRVAVFGYSFVSGDVLVDPSLPVSGVDSDFSTGLVAFMQTFNLAGRTANLVFELPYSYGTTAGFIYDEPAQRTFSGFKDLGCTLAVNLLGAPTMNLKEFQELRAKPRPIVGASLKILAPTGSYDIGRLINVGTNRWSFRPKIGCILPVTDKWLVEAEAGAWFFSDDDDYISGRREQAPIFSGEIHLIRRFKPGFWASVETTYFNGGRQTIGGDRLADVQNNARIGATIVIPFGGRHAIKTGFSTSLTTSYGNEFDQILVTYAAVF